jgi:hypothetical protein
VLTVVSKSGKLQLGCCPVCCNIRGLHLTFRHVRHDLVGITHPPDTGEKLEHATSTDRVPLAVCCINVQVSIDEDTFRALEAVAKAEGKSVSHVAAERLQQL